jgi:hypothetical protein
MQKQKVRTIKEGYKKIVDKHGNIQYVNEKGEIVSLEEATEVRQVVKKGVKKVVDENGNVKYYDASGKEISEKDALEDE